jgi:hypothetical protein
MLTTVKKLQDPIDKSKSERTLAQKLVDPIYIAKDNDNTFVAMNFLGEEVGHKKNTFMQTANRLGFPLYFERTASSQDPRKKRITDMLQVIGRTKKISSSGAFKKDLAYGEDETLTPSDHFKLAKRTGDLIAQEHEFISDGVSTKEYRAMPEDAQAEYAKDFMKRLESSVKGARYDATGEFLDK